MDRDEAAAVAESVIGRLRAMPYQALVDQLLDEVEVELVVGNSGVTYQIEIQARWDSGEPPNLMVMVGVAMAAGAHLSPRWPVPSSLPTTGRSLATSRAATIGP